MINTTPILRSPSSYLALLLVLLTIACSHKPLKSQIDPALYKSEIAQWQEQRLTELTSESGWLTLVGLYWLREGRNQFGNDPDPKNAIVWIPNIPGAFGGAFILEHGTVRLEAPFQPGFTLDGKPVTSIDLKSDADDHPTVLHIGSVSFQVIKRGDRFGVRVRDSQNPDRLLFKGTEFYPADLKWRLDAKFEAYNPPKPMPITNVLGMESSESSPGAVKFEVDGKEYRLDAITEKGETKLFMIIADKTSGKDTYPAGRYLYVDPPNASGHLIIDFNKAYSPPCAFTKFATCPLPPRQNRLPFAIEAGEKYQKHG